MCVLSVDEEELFAVLLDAVCYLRRQGHTPELPLERRPTHPVRGCDHLHLSVTNTCQSLLNTIHFIDINKPGTAKVGAISKAQNCNTEAKRCFATHDEDIDYFNMRIYYFNRMRIYSTVQLCSITSLWHSGQHLYAVQSGGCRFESLGFWLLSKRRSL